MLQIFPRYKNKLYPDALSEIFSQPGFHQGSPFDLPDLVPSLSLPTAKAQEKILSWAITHLALSHTLHIALIVPCSVSFCGEASTLA